MSKKYEVTLFNPNILLISPKKERDLSFSLDLGKIIEQVSYDFNLLNYRLLIKDPENKYYVGIIQKEKMSLTYKQVSDTNLQQAIEAVLVAKY